MNAPFARVPAGTTTATWLERLPVAIRDGLTPEQTRAIASAVATSCAPAYRHPLDLRITMPLPRRPVFLTVVAGRERRSNLRRRAERRRHPLNTFGNVVFMLLSMAGFYALALLAILVAGSIFEV